MSIERTTKTIIEGETENPDWGAPTTLNNQTYFTLLNILKLSTDLYQDIYIDLQYGETSIDDDVLG